MVFANKKQSTKVDITIENKKVLQETSFNYLGLTLSSDLTWHNHIDNMIAKINQKLTKSITKGKGIPRSGHALCIVHIANTTTI